MGTSLPIIRGTSTALYPFTQTYICNTGKSDAQSGATARWVKSPPIVRFEMPFNPLTQADKNTLKVDFGSYKGQFTTNLQLTALGTTWTNLSLDSDEFAAVEQVTTQYGVRWVVTQAIPQNLSAGSSGGGFPLLTNGTMGQLPYTQKKRWQTIVSKVQAGPKYALAEFAGGWANFPTDGVMGWELDERMLTDADVNTRVAHFLANWGSAKPFTFIDEDGNSYIWVFYASDQMVITRQQPNVSSIKTVLVQMPS